jgi:hypothetical protein
VTNWWGAHERGRAFGFFVLAAGSSSVLSFITSLVVLDVLHLDWQWIFRLPVVLMLLGGIVVWLVARDRPSSLGFADLRDEKPTVAPVETASGNESTWQRYGAALRNGRLLLAGLAIGFQNSARYGLLVWVPEDPFESALALEWPIEGLEPLSFVLGRLFDPLAERLERADRGAAILHTHLHLVNRTVHARTLQLPSPLRDAKTLRTLVLLDLETNPPAAAIDQVRVLVEPTPGRVTQWALFERAQPSPEQDSTLLARLKALMGDSHVGSPQLVDSWKPGAFEMTPFAPAAPAAPVAPAAPSAPSAPGAPGAPGAATALRRFRLPVPARVHVHEGRPTRIVTDRRGVTGGAVAQAAGPWRTSGEWWNDAQPGRSWDRDEWDVALTDGTLYRIYVERDIGQWFLEGVVD